MKDKLKKKDGIKGWIFLAPAGFFLTVFTIFAIFFAFYLSFAKVNLFNGKISFIGADNYLRFFSDPKALKATLNTITFASVVVPAQTFIAMVLAAILHKNIPYRNYFKLAFFLPALTSSSALTFIFMFIFNIYGPFNGILLGLNIINEPINFLQNPDFALKVIMIMNIWSTVPIYMVIYLSGLQDISPQIYEAAEIDGASAWNRFWSITVPQLRPITAYVVMVGLIGTLQLFDQAYIFSEGTGGPENSTLTLSLLIYQNAFGGLNSMGYAAALSVLLGGFIFIVAYLSNKFFRATEGVN